MKPARLRPRAQEDLIESARGYVQAGGRALGERAFDAALAALAPLERMPAMGSPRLGQLCEIPGLRSWGVSGFPVQWFYFEAEAHLDVVRLLCDRQDGLVLLGEGP